MTNDKINELMTLVDKATQSASRGDMQGLRNARSDLESVLQAAIDAPERRLPPFQSVDGWMEQEKAAGRPMQAAQIEQEPVGYLWERPGYGGQFSTDKGPVDGWKITPLYAHPQPAQAPWVMLTEGEMGDAVHAVLSHAGVGGYERAVGASAVAAFIAKQGGDI